MFDLTAAPTLESVPNWIEEANRACSGVSSGDVPIFLAGNKSDAAERTVTEPAIQKICAERNLPYTEISVKDNTNIDKLMDTVFAKMLKGILFCLMFIPKSEGEKKKNKQSLLGTHGDTPPHIIPIRGISALTFLCCRCESCRPSIERRRKYEQRKGNTY